MRKFVIILMSGLALMLSMMSPALAGQSGNTPLNTDKALQASAFTPDVVCCIVAHHLRTYYMDGAGTLVSSTNANRVVKVNVDTREWSSFVGGSVTGVDSAATIYNLGAAPTGNVQVDGMDLLTYPTNLLRAECSNCPVNSNGGTTASAFAGPICVTTGTGAYWTTVAVSFRFNGVLRQRAGLNSNATAKVFATVAC